VCVAAAVLCIYRLPPSQAFYVGISRSHSDRLIYIHSGACVRVFLCCCGGFVVAGIFKS
jgi:hypothetical protein